MILKKLLFLVMSINCTQLYAQETILAQAGDVKIIQKNCNDETYECDYVQTFQDTSKILLSDWNKTAVAYQFSPHLIGFKMGATNIPHLLTTYDSHNNSQKFFDVMMIDEEKKCFITQEEVKQNQYEIKFYRLPSLQAYFTMNTQTQGLEDFQSIATHYQDEEDHSFNFNYALIEDDESYYKDIKVLQPCSDQPIIQY